MTDALSEAPAYGIARLLAEGRFVVPSHQRDYAWSDDDVKQLFDDVIDAIKKKSKSYFLGLLVFLYSGEYNDSRRATETCNHCNSVCRN